MPYATPTGFGKDISNFLAAAKGSEAALAKKRMFNNIEVTDAAVGTVVAAQSYANPDVSCDSASVDGEGMLTLGHSMGITG